MWDTVVLLSFQKESLSLSPHSKVFRDRSWHWNLLSALLLLLALLPSISRQQAAELYAEFGMCYVPFFAASILTQRLHCLSGIQRDNTHSTHVNAAIHWMTSVPRHRTIWPLRDHQTLGLLSILKLAIVSQDLTNQKLTAPSTFDSP